MCSNSFSHIFLKSSPHSTDFFFIQYIYMYTFYMNTYEQHCIGLYGQWTPTRLLWLNSVSRKNQLLKYRKRPTWHSGFDSCGRVRKVSETWNWPDPAWVVIQPVGTCNKSAQCVHVFVTSSCGNFWRLRLNRRFRSSYEILSQSRRWRLPAGIWPPMGCQNKFNICRRDPFLRNTTVGRVSHDNAIVPNIIIII